MAAERLWRRVAIGGLCSLTYLVAAFYGEGAFKETIMAGLLLGFVLHLEQMRSRWADATEGGRFGLVLPAGLLVAGAIYNYSYPGVIWFVGTLVVWLLAEAALQPRSARAWVSRLDNAAALAQWTAGASWRWGRSSCSQSSSDLQAFFKSIGLSPAGTAQFAPGTLGNLFHPLSRLRVARGLVELGLPAGPREPVSRRRALGAGVGGRRVRICLFGPSP